MSKNFETSLTIKAGVQGTEQIAKLSAEIEAAGGDVADLSKKGNELSKSFNQLERQQGLIDSFVALKKSAKDNNDELKKAQSETSALAKSYHAAKDKVAALEAEMTKGGKATREQKEALSQAKKEANDLEKAFNKSISTSQKLSTTKADLQTKLSAVKAQMKGAGLSTNNLSNQQQTLAQKSAVAKSALDELNDEAVRLSHIAKAKVTLGIDTDDKAKKQIQEITAAYNLLKKEGGLSHSELVRAGEVHKAKLKELETQLSATSDEAHDTAISFGELAGKLGQIAGQAGGLAVIAKSAMDFEVAMAGVKKTVDGTPEQIAALSSQLKDLAVQLGISSNEVAGMAALGGQLGIPIDKLGEFTRMAGQMAVAFGMSAEEAGNAAAKLANVFDIPIEQVGELGDAISTLGNNTAAKEKEIVEAMLRIGGSAKQFGLAKEQAASLAAAFISLGKPPEVAATAINALLTKLQTAQSQGNDFKKALQGIGISADEMADAIAKNPQVALSTFLGKLGQLDERQRSIASVKLFGAEYADDINVLVGSLGTYNNALSLTADKASTLGAMQKEFDAQMSTATAKVNQAKVELTNLAITLGQHLLPVVSAVASGVTALTGTIKDFATTFPAITQLAVIIGSSIVAIKALNSVLSLAGGIGSKSALQITTSFLSAKTAIDSTTISIGKMGDEIGKAGTQTAGLAKQMTSLNGIMAALSAWTIGNSIGEWAYESSAAVRAIGDEMARMLAYADAIFTDRTFDDVRQHFETSAQAAACLSNETAKAADETERLANTQKDIADTTNTQTQAQTELLNSIVLTQTELDALEAKLVAMSLAGQKGTQAYQDLQNEFTATQTKLKDLKSEAENQGLGEAIKTDVQKASAAFEALGLDMDEFSTGINSKAKSALEAFSTVANLAGDDVEKLARAYNAAEVAAGNNAKAQDELNTRLLASVNGNHELAEAIKRTAQAQRQAKAATDEQSQALARLGVDMEAANARMSASAHQVVKDLKMGIQVIKDTAQSADSLKIAINQALDTALASAKTQNDFKAIQAEIQKAGVQAHVTAENMAKIRAGASQGSEGVKELNQRVKETAKSAEQVAVSGQKAGQAMAQGAKHADRAWQNLNQTVKDTTKNAQKASESMQQAGKHSKEGYEAMAKFFNPHANQDSVIDYLKKQGLSESQAKEGARRFETERRGLSQQIANAFNTRTSLRPGEKTFDDKLKDYADSVKHGDGQTGQIGQMAKDVASAWDERIEQAEIRGAKRFAEQLRLEAKMRAR